MRRLSPLVLVLSLPACPGDLENPERFAVSSPSSTVSTPSPSSSVPSPAPSGSAPPGTCPDVVTKTLAPLCASGGCHSAKTRASALDLASPDIVDRLRGVKASGGAGLLIDEKDLSRSVLLLKLQDPPPFGNTMPLGNEPLDPATVACITAWLQKEIATK